MSDLPCIGGCGRVGAPNLDTLYDIYECETCGDARADAVAASLPGQEIENDGWA